MFKQYKFSLWDLGLLVVLGTLALVASFQMVVTPTGMVTVVEERPYIFGEGGVQKTVLHPGRAILWASSHPTSYPATAIMLEQEFIDLATHDESLLIFKGSIQAEVTDAVLLHSEFNSRLDSAFSRDWTDTIVEPRVSDIFRDIAKKHSAKDIIASRPVAEAMKTELLKRLNDELQAENIPVRIADFNFGQVSITANQIKREWLSIDDQLRAKTAMANDLKRLHERKMKELREAMPDH